MGCRYEGTGIWAGRCKGTREVDPCPGYDKCKQYKPDYPTKADRIRAMSDEELAMHYANYEYEVAKQILAIVGIDIAIIEHDLEVSAKEYLERLQQPAGGADDGTA